MLKLPPVSVRLYLPFAATGVPLKEPEVPEDKFRSVVNVLVETEAMVMSTPSRTSAPDFVIPQVPVTRTTSPTANPWEAAVTTAGLAAVMPVTVTKLPGNVPSTLSAWSAVSISTAVSRFRIKFFVLVVASSIACVSENEKKEGVICIDIGCETTKVVVYMKNNVIYAENFTLGGNNVSLDLSHGLQISDEAAELAKIKYGTVVAPFNEKVELELDSNKRKLISKNLLYGIIKPRYDEILEIIRDKVFDNIYARVAINSVVLTGGASKIFGLKNICENIFNRKTRIATNLIKNSFFYDKPEFSTLIGMIKLVKDFKLLNQVPDISQNKIYKVMDRIDTWIEESYI